LGPDIYHGTSKNSLTGRYSVYNWLNNLEFKNIFLPKLKDFFIKSHYSFPIILQCWVNIFRTGEGIMPHQHGENIMSANVFICGDSNIGTKFLVNHRIKNIQNKEGNITIFPGTMSHYVNSNPTNDVRISIAMDIYLNEEKFYEFVIDSENRNRYYKIEN
jgi:hypothetical protein